MRLIDAEALKTDIVENSITLEGVMAIETDCAKVLIDNAPTVEPDKLSSALNCSIRAEYGGCEGCELSCPRNELIRILNLERPHGKWISRGNIGGAINCGRSCSLCGKVVEFSENYCPGCGADMREANDET